MGVPVSHVFKQGKVIKTLAKVAFSGGNAGGGAVCPGPEIVEELPPRDASLVRDYIKHVGGDLEAYGNTLPPHLFPQWGFPLLAQTIAGTPYPLSKVLNGGARIEIHKPLPADEPLECRAQLVEIDDNGRRAILKQKLITGTKSAPEALVCYVNGLVMLKRGDGDGGEKKEVKKERPTIPDNAREIARWKLPKNAGLHFAILTGDFNPIHWVGPYAKMSGFRGVILHGFGTLARTIESMNKELWAGDVRRLSTIEARFVRPVNLPGDYGVYVDDAGAIWVGKAAGQDACLIGDYTAREGDTT